MASTRGMKRKISRRGGKCELWSGSLQTKPLILQLILKIILKIICLKKYDLIGISASCGTCTVSIIY